MVLNHAPNLRLIIEKSRKEEIDLNSASTWNSRDTLRGNLQIICSNKDDSVIEKITVYFEGVSRNWMPDETSTSGILKAERRFISQAQDISLFDVSQRALGDQRTLLETSFYFIIPNMIAHFDPDSPEICLHLPPTLRLGGLIAEKSTGHLFAQPSISYYLRAEVILRLPGSERTESLETILPVTVIPHTNELPPIETNDFPSEFVEDATQILKSSILGTELGILNISLSEPPPLVFGKDSASSSTDAVLKLAFNATATQNNTLDILRNLKSIVHSLVRVKTFYTIKSFPRPPGQDSLSTQNDTRLREDMVRLEPRTVANASWGYRFDLERQTLNEFQSTSTKSAPSYESFISRSSTSSASSSRESRSHQANGRWISNWTLPIQVDGKLLPTFCSAMVARSYSLIVRVKVSGVRQEVFDLEVSLQVVHTVPSTEQPTGESFLRPRRGSASSWFSEELQETEMQPPSYYK